MVTAPVVAAGATSPPGDVTVGAVLPTARPTSRRPLEKSVPVPGTLAAVLVSTAATSSAVIPGWAAITRAAAAETSGVANEVPSGVTQQFPSAQGVASVRTPTPGAAMSIQGPRREKLASVSSRPSTAATARTPGKAAG